MAIHKLTLPVRIPLTVFLIPLAHRVATRTGVIKVFDIAGGWLGMEPAHSDFVNDELGGVAAAGEDKKAN